MGSNDDGRKDLEFLILMTNTFSLNTDRDLIPADLNTEMCEFTQDFSLVHLSCKQIIKDTKLLKEISACLPINRYPALLKRAILYDYHSSASFLMSTWPSTIVSMSDVVPGVADTSRILVHHSRRLGYLAVAAKGLNLLIELFLDIMKNTPSPTLRVLDLRGLHLTEKIVSKLIRETVCFIPGIDGSYHFIIDCEIRDYNVGTMMTTLFKISRSSVNVKARLHISKLDICRLDETQSWELLKYIDSTELVGLCLSPIYSKNFYEFVLTTFKSLVALDMSLTELNISESKGDKLTLDLLPRLRRLSIKNGRNNLSTILPPSILGELEFLDITNCQPGQKLRDDIAYLTSISLYLQELHLRGFAVEKCDLDLWRNFLRSLAPSLKMLALVKCFQNDGYFGYFVGFILLLVNLRYLKLNENILTMKTLLEHATKLGVLPHLKAVTLPFECTEEDLINFNFLESGPDRIQREEIEKRFAIEKSPPVFVEWMPAPTRW